MRVRSPSPSTRALRPRIRSPLRPLAAAVVVSATLVTGMNALWAVAAPAAPAGGTTATSPTPPESSTGIAGWQRVGHSTVNTLEGDQGLTTVVPPSGQPYLLYRGDSSVPKKLADQGWGHIGDPDSAQGYIFDAYQNSDSNSSVKMYLVTTPAGRRYEYVHQLVKGELYNNSFVAVSRGGRWMVSGTWGTVDRLQVYPTPILNRSTPPQGGSLSLAGSIHLDHPVNNVQGCDFLSATRLVCQSDDSTRALFSNRKPLLEVTLSAPLRRGVNQGHVEDLGSVPRRSSSCSGQSGFEAEGVDFDPATGILRAEMIEPARCILTTDVYWYRQRPTG